MPETTSRLRHDIDSGKTGDKVDFPDPAAAPLGTDAEAGGQPAASALPLQPAKAAPPPRSGMRRDQLGVAVYACVAAAAAAGIVGAVIVGGA